MGYAMQREVLEGNPRQAGPGPLGWLLHDSTARCSGGLAELATLTGTPPLAAVPTEESTFKHECVSALSLSYSGSGNVARQAVPN